MNALAHILPPPKEELRSLFYGPDTTAKAEQLDGKIAVEEGSMLSFEGYFNVFFEDPFITLTELREATLQLTLEGKFEVAIYRTESSGTKHLLHKQESDFVASHPTIYPAALVSEGSGYLYFTVHAKGSHCRFISAAWGTTTSPRQEVRLVGVTRTYLRNEQLLNLLSSLAEAPAPRGQPFELIVVDNSNTMAPDALAEFGCRVIPQQNSGSSGGFTRGILDVIENTKRHQATHIVLMDDDIEILPETLFRAIQILRFQSRPSVLGAPLFDRHKPEVMDVSGETFATGKSALSPRALRQRFAPVGERLAAGAAVGSTDWTGWWFAVFPVEAFDQELPLPLFLRGDDIEFGLRLKTKGIPSRYIPGWAVWHEPFGSAAVRIPDWIHYYNMRNGLIHRALHAGDINVSQLAWQIFTQQFNHYVYTFQYGAADALLQGVEAFLSGPDILFNQSPRKIHADILATCDRLAPDCLSESCESSTTQPPSVPLWQQLAGVLTLHGHLLPRFLSRRPSLFIHKRDLRRRHTLGREEMHVQDQSTGRTVACRRDRQVFFDLWRRRNRLKSEFLHEFTAKASFWRASSSKYQSAAFWRSYLGLREEAPAIYSAANTQPDHAISKI